MAAMVCVPPTSEVMTWLYTPYPHLAVSDVSMVDTSQDSTPGDDWWVVAITWQESGVKKIASFLTNAPGKQQLYDQKWITLDQAWSATNWTGSGLVVGMSAQAKALSCLP